jgi:hypothetical protein
MSILKKIIVKLGQWGSQWLNPAGRVVLIKCVLSPLPLYISSAMLAPSGIMNQIAMNIQKELWLGGKYNSKKYHLAN